MNPGPERLVMPNGGGAAIAALGWGAVATWMAQGAVQWVAGQIMQELFGSKYSFADELPKLVEAIRTVVREEIEDNELKLLAADTEACQEMIDRFIGLSDDDDREKREPLLNDASTLIIRVVSKLRAFGLAGHHSFMLAKSLEIAIWSVRVDYFDSSSELDALKKLIQDGLDHHDALSGNYATFPDFEVLNAGNVINPECAKGKENWRDNQSCAHCAIFSFPNSQAKHFVEWQILDAGVKSPPMLEPDQVKQRYLEIVANRWSNITYPTYVEEAEGVARTWRSTLSELPDSKE